jgi:hypothetical protein
MEVSRQLHARPGRFTPGEKIPGTHCIGCWVSPRTDPDAMRKSRNPYPCRESNPGRIASSLVTVLTELSRLPNQVCWHYKMFLSIINFCQKTILRCSAKYFIGATGLYPKPSAPNTAQLYSIIILQLSRIGSLTCSDPELMLNSFGHEISLQMDLYLHGTA